MIAKKFSVIKGKSKASSIRDLTDYIRNARNSNEKVIYENARGFISTEPRSQQIEMISLANEAVKSANPVNHYVFSWKNNEQPSAEQIERVVDIFEEETKLNGHQIVYGVHKDTDNLHMHLAVNRVNQTSNKTVKINKGFDIECIHKVISRVENEQGWEREKNGRYVVLENGELGREHTTKDQPKNITQKSRDQEKRTGEKSPQRVGIEQAGPVIKAAKNWQDLHENLNKIGMRYEKEGSGAKIYIGEKGIKASSAYRAGSIIQLQKRFGLYEPSSQKEPNVYIKHTVKQTEELHLNSAGLNTEHGLRKLSECYLATVSEQQKNKSVLQIDERANRQQSDLLRRQSTRENRTIELEPLVKNINFNFEEYKSERGNHFKDKNTETLELRNKHEKERKKLADEQKDERKEFFNGNWKGKGQALNALRSLLAGQQAVSKLKLKEQQQRDRENLRERFKPFPEIAEWHKKQKEYELVDDWKNRAKQETATITCEATSNKTETEKTIDLRDYTPEIVGKNVHYTSKNSGEEAFVDKGKTIDINNAAERESILAALQLAAQKWGDFQVNGTDEYKQTCIELAAEHGFKINNKELQESINEQREAIKENRKNAMKTEQLKQFESYAEAVNAETYRVTSIKMRDDGTRQAFILGKKEGKLNGYTNQELTTKIMELKRLQERGENIYYTPLSRDKHHILIDDMSKEKLEKLIEDGFKPAAVLTTSPGNYQAIITIKKLDTQHDKDVANRLSEQLNKKYGDPKLSGAIHPHRAPGYENRKPKHKQDDGSYPSVRLLKSEKRECEKTLELSKALDDEYRQRLAERPQRVAVAVPTPTPIKLDDRSAERGKRAYEAHLRDVLRRQKGDIDLSRVDSMIAIRMRTTGHSQQQIEKTILNSAPEIRKTDENRNWQDYAQRTALFAFSAAGDAQVNNLFKYQEKWFDLEKQNDDLYYNMITERVEAKNREKATGIKSPEPKPPNFFER